MAPIVLPPSLTSPDSRLLADAWHGWRGTRLLPSRTAFDLAALRRCAGRLVLLELRSPEEIVFRVAGTEIRDRLGFELTGQNFLDLVPGGGPEGRRSRSARLWAEAQQPCGAYTIYPLRFPSGAGIDVEAVSFPLDGEGRSGPLLLGVVTECAPPPPEEPSPGVKPLLRSRVFGFIDIGAGTPADPGP